VSEYIIFNIIGIFLEKIWVGPGLPTDYAPDS